VTRPDEGSASREWAACTIVSKNYLAYARVLARSFARHHPGVRFFVLLADRIDGAFDAATEPFELVTADQLELADLAALAFKYTVVELNTALKPFFLSYLLRRHGLGKLVFLDPDILVLDSLEPIPRLLDDHDIVVTPHLLEPIDDGRHPGEIEILQAGTFNLGFVAVTAASDLGLLPWWQRRLRDHCVMEPALGVHVDQKWIDLAPCFFAGVHVLRDPTYNVAYWNLHERAAHLRRAGDRWMLGKDPVRFFHFSGVDIGQLEQVSKHQDRFRLADLPHLRELFERYRALLLGEGHEQASGHRYAFGAFDNGAAIPREARSLYRELGDRAARFGDPFATAGSDSFFRYLNQGVDHVRDPARVVSRLWWQIYGGRTDVQRVFPDALRRDRGGVLGWIRTSGAAEHKVDPRMCPPAAPGAEAVVPRGDDRLLPRLYASAIAPREAKVRSVVERLVRPGSRQWRALGELRLRIGGIVPPLGGSLAPPHRRPTPAGLPWGVNLAGYLGSEKGMGEAVRADIRCLEAAGIPYALNDFVDIHNSENREQVGARRPDNPYRINLVHINADQVDQFVHDRGSAYLADRYNIGYWVWELSEFPAAWRSKFALFDEIWVPSSFVLDAISREASVPVVRIPHAMAPATAVEPLELAELALPRGAFVFLFVFDFCSLAARKNPLGLIEAFKRAFGSADRRWLVIKCSHSEVDPDALAAMRAAAVGANVRIVDRVLERAEVRGLMARADCYVSLHRSEGFGLTIAEAMAIGKPVIATAYGGNTDFTTAANSVPVPYDLVPLERDHGPYRQGRVWAEPDLVRAAEAMRYVVAQPDAARALGARAARDVATMLSPSTIGRLVERRLRTVAGD
jgi:glycosyltransferase involved in cell wall biosynthesis